AHVKIKLTAGRNLTKRWSTTASPALKPALRHVVRPALRPVRRDVRAASTKKQQFPAGRNGRTGWAGSLIIICHLDGTPGVPHPVLSTERGLAAIKVCPR
ncbi:hypothetical protein pipiens_020201, partial [Culex pipiens pipiens]